MQEKTFSGYLTRSVIQFAAHQGMDIQALCFKVGLDPIVLTTPDQRISASNHYAVWREVIKQTGDEHLSLHIGEAFNVGNYGIVGYILLNCQTLADVFEKYCRYTYLFCQGVPSQLSISEGMASFECICGPGLTFQDNPPEASRHDAECTFASTLAAVKSLTGKELRPSMVSFRHASPGDISEYQRIFQTDPKFSMPFNRMTFNAAYLDWPVLSSNADLLTFFEQQANVMLGMLDGDEHYSQKVTHLIAERLKGELPKIDAIAAALSISTRHLQRELQAEGTSFQKLLDNTRKELALRHLEDPTFSIHDIAFLLGFSEPSAFNRAFKRWTGTTPRYCRLIRQMKPIQFTGKEMTPHPTTNLSPR
ncbi:MAG: AraC family transcriptional regulator [Leptolyngbyaceae bacterium]|nr:AraC family transcriptional regulator [Leptolyngbyaceae bacterium]